MKHLTNYLNKTINLLNEQETPNKAYLSILSNLNNLAIPKYQKLQLDALECFKMSFKHLFNDAINDMDYLGMLEVMDSIITMLNYEINELEELQELINTWRMEHVFKKEEHQN